MWGSVKMSLVAVRRTMSLIMTVTAATGLVTTLLTVLFEAVVDGDGGNGSGDDVADGVNDVDDTAFGNNGDDGVDEAEGGVERGEPMM